MQDDDFRGNFEISVNIYVPSRSNTSLQVATRRKRRIAVPMCARIFR